MPDTVQDLIRKAATAAGVPPALALAVAEQESGFNPTVFGPEITVGGQKTRAVGTFQLLPETAKGLGIDPMDPRQNIDGGVKYLRQLLDQHQGDLTKVLKTYGGVVRDEKYVPGVMERLTKFQQATTPAAPIVPGTTEPVRTLPGVATRGMMAQSTVAGDPAVPPAEPSLMQSMAAGFDPRTTEGRIGLAATAAGIAAAPFTGGTSAGVLPWVARILGPPLAAAVAGGGTAAVEQQLGTAPAGTSPVLEGAKQGAYEVGGRLFMWPIRRVGGAFLASKVGKDAAEALTAGIGRARETGRTAVDTVRARVAEGLEAARMVADATRESAVLRGRQALSAARRAAGVEEADIGRRAAAQTVQARERAAQILADTELQNADAISSLTRQYDDLLSRAPSVTAPGQLTRAAVEGPAKRALDMAGQRVSEAASAGPMISVTPIQAALDEMASKARPASLFPATETPKGIGFLTGVVPRREGAAASTSTRMSREEFQKFMAQQLGVDETHPLPGILGQFQQVKLEQLPFQDVHRLKMLLDEAVNWDRVAKKHLEKITKGLRSVVRDALSVHEPYNAATAAYQAMVPLYRRGIGKSVITAAVNDPDKIARTLNPKNPAQATALKDLLVTQSAAGGDAQTGLQAWDAVRSAFVYDKVIKGGIEGLADRVHALIEQSPEFAKAVFDDEPAQRILSNLDRLGQAFQFVQQQGAERVAGAKATGKTLVESAKTYGAEEVAEAGTRAAAQVDSVREAARQAVREARQQGQQSVASQTRVGRSDIKMAERAARAAVAAARAEKGRLQASTIGAAQKFESQIADMLRAVGLGPRSLWGALSIVRLLESPKASDLVEWAAYSDQNTQRLVRALTGQMPDRAVAGLLREMAGVLYAPTPPTPSSTPSPVPVQ